MSTKAPRFISAVLLCLRKPSSWMPLPSCPHLKLRVWGRMCVGHSDAYRSPLATDLTKREGKQHLEGKWSSLERHHWGADKPTGMDFAFSSLSSSPAPLFQEDTSQTMTCLHQCSGSFPGEGFLCWQHFLTVPCSVHPRLSLRNDHRTHFSKSH